MIRVEESERAGGTIDSQMSCSLCKSQDPLHARRFRKPRCHDPAALKEHVLRAHQADAFAPKLLRLSSERLEFPQVGTGMKLPPYEGFMK